MNEPGLQIHCDACGCDLTHSIRIKCADPACEPGDGVDICPGCFCAGKEFAKHKRDHRYRVVVGHFTVGFLAGSLWIARAESPFLPGTTFLSNIFGGLGSR